MSSPAHQAITILSRYLKRFSLITVLIFLGILTITYGSPIQEQERTVTKLETPKDPVKIALVKTKKGAVEIDRKFMGEDDWFKGLTVRVKNTSGKAITYLRVGLSFPRDKSYILADPRDPMQTVPYSHSIGYGGRQVYMPDSPPLGLPPIAPGENVDLELSDREYQDVRIALAQLNYPASIKKIEVRPEVVYFEDGMFWQAGGWYQRDPKNPKKLYLIDPDNPEKPIPIEPSTTPSGVASPAVFFILRGSTTRTFWAQDQLYFTKPPLLGLFSRPLVGLRSLRKPAGGSFHSASLSLTFGSQRPSMSIKW